jgi:ABC-type transport system involved in multi-copper enzyme maturation permease subunit
MNPMFERDFLGFAQKKRFFILRTGIVAAPVLGLIALAMLSDKRQSDELGQGIFAFTTYPLLVLALLIAPALLAHSIVIERKLNTIEVLRTTTLSAWKIVWGKWSGRTLLLLLICIAALPLAASSLLFGGVSPMQLLQFAIVLFGSVLWATSLALLVSSVAKDVTNSMRLSVVLVLFGTIGTAVLTAALAYILHELRIKEEYSFILLQTNPVAVLVMVQEPRMIARAPGLFLHPAYTYGLLSLLATSAFLFFSTRMLKRDSKRPFLQEPAGAASAPVQVAARDGHIHFVQSGGPKRRWLASWLDRAPMVWLEVNQVVGRRRNWVRIATILFLVLLEIGFLYALKESWQSGGMLKNAKRNWGIHAAAAVAFLFMGVLSVVSLGAAAFRRDNDAKTLEALYATPLTSDDLLRGKIAGVLFAVAPSFIMAQVHAFLAMLMQALHPLAWVWWVLSSTTLLLAAAAFAMWVGLKSKSVLQANLFAMGGFGLWMVVIPMFLGIMFAMMNVKSSGSEFVGNFLFGWHPGYIALAPFIAGYPSNDNLLDVDGWWMTLIYLILYGVFAFVVLRRSIPTLFRAIREGYEWQRSPLK